MTSKTRAKLRSLASQTSSLFQIGKGGINDELSKGVSQALDKRELVKISVLKTSPVSAKEAMELLSESLKAEPIAATGNTLVLYRKSNADGVKHIEL